MKAVLGTLEYLNSNSIKIKKLIRNTRRSVSKSKTKNVILQMEHVADGIKELILHSLKTNKDSLITVTNFHTKVENLLESTMPAGFLIPKTNAELVALLQKHGIDYKNYEPVLKEVIYQYQIISNEKKQIEDREVNIPNVNKKKYLLTDKENYLYVPLNQLHSKMLMLMFEPQSMLNILQYTQYSFWLADNSLYPILRVERN